jgi:hypothetical protein
VVIMNGGDKRDAVAELCLYLLKRFFGLSPINSGLCGCLPELGGS